MRYILIFILIIIILLFCFRLKKFKETFYSLQCDRNNIKQNINLVFHNLNMDFSIKNIKLKNYINQDFIEKIFINILNNIYNYVNIGFNFEKIIEENIKNNLKLYYDFKLSDNVDPYIKIKNFVNNDIEIFSNLLKKKDIFENAEAKNLLSLYFRKILTNYQDDNSIHIVLVPYLCDKEILILEGDNNKPIILLSLYKLVNGKPIDAITTFPYSIIRGKWLTNYTNDSLRAHKVCNKINDILKRNKNQFLDTKAKYDIIYNKIKGIQNHNEIHKNIIGLAKKSKYINKSSFEKLTSINYKDDYRVKNIRVNKYLKDNPDESVSSYNYKSNKLEEIKSQDKKIAQKAYDTYKNVNKFLNKATHKKELDKANIDIKPLEKKLDFFYTHKFGNHNDKNSVCRLTTQLKKLKMRINKVNYFIDKLHSSLLLCNTIGLLLNINLKPNNGDFSNLENSCNNATFSKFINNFHYDFENNTIFTKDNRTKIKEALKNKYYLKTNDTKNNFLDILLEKKEICDNIILSKKCNYDNINPTLCNESLPYDNECINDINKLEELIDLYFDNETNLFNDTFNQLIPEKQEFIINFIVNLCSNLMNNPRLKLKLRSILNLDNILKNKLDNTYFYNVDKVSEEYIWSDETIFKNKILEFINTSTSDVKNSLKKEILEKTNKNNIEEALKSIYILDLKDIISSIPNLDIDLRSIEGKNIGEDLFNYLNKQKDKRDNFDSCDNNSLNNYYSNYNNTKNLYNHIIDKNNYDTIIDSFDESYI